LGCPSRGWHAATRSTGSSEADIAHAACRWAQPAYLLVQKRLLERHVPPCRVAVDAAQVVSAAAGMKFWLQTGPHTPSGTWRTMSPTIWLAELPQVCAGGRQSAAAAKLRIEPTRRTIKRYAYLLSLCPNRERAALVVHQEWKGVEKTLPHCSPQKLWHYG